MVAPLLQLGEAMELAQDHLVLNVIVKTGLLKRSAHKKERNLWAFPSLQNFGMQLPDWLGDLGQVVSFLGM